MSDAEERKKISEDAAREGNIQALIKQLQEQETPSKVKAKDSNLLKESFNPEADDALIINRHLYKYNLDFPGLMKNVSYILKQKPEQKIAKSTHLSRGG